MTFIVRKLATEVYPMWYYYISFYPPKFLFFVFSLFLSPGLYLPWFCFLPRYKTVHSLLPKLLSVTSFFWTKGSYVICDLLWKRVRHIYRSTEVKVLEMKSSLITQLDPNPNDKGLYR